MEIFMKCFTDVLPYIIGWSIFFFLTGKIINFFLFTVPVADVEEKQAQEFIEKKEEQLEKHTKQFNYDGKIKCEYCDTWQHLNDSGRCSNCNAELEIRK